MKLNKSLKTKKLREDYSTRLFYSELAEYIRYELEDEVDNIVSRASMEFPQYDPEWCSDDYSPVEEILYDAAHTIAENMLAYAPSGVPSNLLKGPSEPLVLSIDGEKFDDALRNKDYRLIYKFMKDAFTEIHDARPDVFTDEDFEDVLNRLESVSLDDLIQNDNPSNENYKTLLGVYDDLLNLRRKKLNFIAS